MKKPAFRLFGGDNDMKRELYANAFLGQIHNAALYRPLCTENDQMAASKSILVTPPPEEFQSVEECQKYNYRFWFCRCIFKRAEIKPAHIDVPETLYWLSLIQIGTKETDHMYNLLIQIPKKKFSDPEMNEICRMLGIMKDKHSGLYLALNRYVDCLIKKIDREKLFQVFHVEVFGLTSRFDNSYLEGFNFDSVDFSSLRKLWQIPNISKNQKAITLLQRLFQCAEPYPAASRLIGSDSYLTLLNESICKERSFFDLLIRPCRDFVIKSQFSECANFTKLFPELRPVVMLCEFEGMRGDKATFEDGVIEFLEDSSQPMVRKMMNRFKNDRDLLGFMYTMTGRRVEASELWSQSIPYFLQNNLQMIDLETLQAFRPLQMYSVSDKHRLLDYSVIFAYKTIVEVLEQIHSRETVSMFANSLALINTDFVLDATIIDIFSLVFLKDEHGEYICSLEIAESIVSTLLTLCTDNVYLKRASHFLECARSINAATLRDVLVPVGNLVIDLLKTKDFEIAKNLAHGNERLTEVIYTAEAIYKLNNLEPFTYKPELNKSRLAIEYLLCFNKDAGFPIDEEQFLQMSRKSGPADPMEVINSDHLYTVLDHISSDWTVSGIDLHKYHMLKAFCDFKRTQKSGHAGIRSLNEIIADIMSDPEITWDEVESILGRDKASEQIFQYGHGNKLTQGGEIYTVLREKHPLSLVCLTKSTTETYSDNRFIKAAISESILKQPEIATPVENIREYLDECDLRLVEIDSSTIRELTLLALSECNYDIIDELYLRDPHVVDEVMNAQKESMTIDVMAKLASFAHIGSLGRVPLEPITAAACIEKLLLQKEYEMAELVARDFANTEIVEKTVIAQLAGEMSSDDLLRIELTFPGLKPHVDSYRKKLAEKKQIYVDHVICNELETASTASELIPKLDRIRRDVDVVTPELMRSIARSVLTVVNDLAVDSLDSELHVCKTVSTMIDVVSAAKLHMKSASEAAPYESLFIQLQHLGRFADNCFYGRFRVSYSFRDFSSKNAGISLARICRMYDDESLFRDIQSLWMIDADAYDPCIICFKLGILEDGMVLLKRARNLMKLLNCDHQYIALELVSVLTHPLPIDITSVSLGQGGSGMRRSGSLALLNESELTNLSHGISSGKVKFPSLYSQTKNTIDEAMGMILSSPQISTLLDAFDVIETPEIKISHFAKTGMFDEAFSSFEKMPLSQSAKTSLFVRVFITSALSFSNWNGFLRRLMRRIDTYMPIILDVFTFFRQNSLFTVMFDMQKGIQFYDDAITTGIHLYHESTSWKAGIAILLDLRVMINRSLATSGSAQHHSFLSQVEILNLQHRVALQTSIWQLFDQCKYPFDRDLDLLGGKESAVKLGAKLLLNMHVGHFSEICELPGVSIGELCEVAVEQLAARKDAQLPQFFKKLARIERATYRKIVECLAKSIHHRAASDAAFVAFIKANVQGTDIRAIILAKSGFVNEAVQLAGKNQALLREIHSVISTCK